MLKPTTNDKSTRHHPNSKLESRLAEIRELHATPEFSAPAATDLP
jgi:hypothetical protein